MCARFSLLLSLVLAAAVLHPQACARAGQTDLEPPEDSQEFGYTVDILPNGNIVVTDRTYDAGPEEDAGAVFLYSPSGKFISKLTGRNARDRVGGGGIVVLANGNYLVRSHRWDAGPNAQDAGAVTWCSGVTGLNGVISEENSLVGSSSGDFIGNSSEPGGGGVFPLPDGDYVVCSPGWRNGMMFGAGAVTWGNGKTGTAGVVSAANSLVGSATDERLGYSLPRAAVTPLGASGNYVVSSPRWSNGEAFQAGAVIWCPGDGSRTGRISPANALVGTVFNSSVGNGGVFPLPNGNYVVCSPRWSNRVGMNPGAVTWCPGGGGLTGPVTEANSLTGSSQEDNVGGRDTTGSPSPSFPGAVTVLTDGNYTVSTPFWKNGDIYRAGAVTWCDGTTGRTGKITRENSLTGEQADDTVGAMTVALPGGHYVAASFNWSNGELKSVGAVMRVPGGGPFSGMHTEVNSLTGSQVGDGVGGGGVTLLGGGHYVVSSPAWDLDAVIDAGAVTWCDGAAGRTGPVTAENSLTGSSAGDRVGAGASSRHGVTALTNGNYVVASPLWAKGPVLKTGAVTWCPGDGSLTGPVTTANSLTGSSENDQAGGYYDATGGFTRPYNPARGVTALSNGNYVVNTPLWDNGAAQNAGAVTWCNGFTGRTGDITAANSLTGGRSQDGVGSGAVRALPGGGYTVFSPDWHNPADNLTKAGAVTLGDGVSGTAGLVGADNSVRGTIANGGVNLNFSADAAGRTLAVGRLSGGVVAVFSYSAEKPFGENGGSPKVEWLPGGSVSLGFKAVPGGNYRLQRSSDLTTWTEGAPVTADVEGSILWTDEVPLSGKVFYRLVVP